MMEVDFNNTGLTPDGANTWRQLGERLRPDELAFLNARIGDLQTYVGLLNAASAGDPDAVKAFGDVVLSYPLPDQPMLTGRRPIPPISESPLLPCYLGAPHPGTFTFAGLNIARTYTPAELIGGELDLRNDYDTSFFSDNLMAEDFQAVLTWVDRAFAGWVVRAGPIELVLNSGQRWLNGGDPSDLLNALDLLRSPYGVLPTNNFRFPCLDERQVCITEFLFTAMSLLGQLGGGTFPTIGSVTPLDQCLSLTGPMSIILWPPTGQQFPNQQTTLSSHTLPAIDHQPAKILSWIPGRIELALPKDIKAGCHTVGWVYLSPPDVVSQLHAIGEQCRPWFGESSLTRAPYIIWENQGQFSLIGAPSINTFHGPNGFTTVSAEACTPVTLWWDISLDACPGTPAKKVVRLWRDGQLFKTSLPDVGSLVVGVGDSSNRTYTLRAESRLGNKTCGQTERSVTINRYHVLRAQAQGDTRCVQPGIGVTLRVTISCPAPQGGVPVTIASSHPARVAATSGTINQGSKTTQIEVLAGNECGTATLTITAPNHQQAQVTITIANYPTINSISPTAFQTCEGISLTVDGSCLGEQAADIRAGVELDGKSVPGTVTVLNAGTRLKVDLPALPAGTYMLVINYCDQVGYAPVPITVTARPPIITTPLNATPTTVSLCTTSSITIKWTVQFATRIILTRAGASQVLAERNYPDPCASVNDALTETLAFSTVMKSVTYTLTAFNADGVMATSSSIVLATPGAPPASAIVVANTSSIVVNVFLFSALGGIFVGNLSPNNTRTISLTDCVVQFVHSLDPKKVDEHNTAFGDNLSATDPMVAMAFGALWSRFSTPQFLGDATSGPAGVFNV